MTSLEYALKNYEILKQYVEGELTAEQFETSFLDFHSMLKDETDDELYNILEEELFYYVDSFFSECHPEQETDFEVSEQTLKLQSQIALQRLKAYLERRGVNNGY